MVAGSQYTFKIQTRDFYSNNLEKSLNQPNNIEHIISYTSGEKTVLATLTDDVNQGVLLVAITLEQAGAYNLQILLNQHEVPTYLTSDQIVVSEKP